MNWLIILICCLGNIACSEPIADPVYSKELQPMSIVDNVHVVTGQFTKSFVDHSIPGSDPLRIERHYATRMGSLDGFQYLDDFRGRVNANEAYFPSMNGSHHFYDHVGDHQYNLHPYRNKRGLNNVVSGYPSGTTNLKNNRLKFSQNTNLGKQDTCFTNVEAKQYLCDGTIRTFSAIGVNEAGDGDVVQGVPIVNENYVLVETRLPSGNHVQYTYERHLNPMLTMENWTPIGVIINKYTFLCKRVQLVNSSKDKVLSYYDITSCNHYSNWFRQPITITTSDGKQLKFQVKKVGDRSVLSTVEMAGKRPEHYNYEFHKTNQGGYYELTSIHQEDGRKIEIEYYRPGKNEVRLQTIKVDKGSNMESRVKFIKLPMGKNGSLKVARTFVYHLNEQRNEGNSYGYTEVYDGLGHRKDYHYNQDGLIERIQFYQRDKKLDKQERYYWGSGMDQGQLLTKTIQDANGQILVAEHFQYDPAGNVLQYHYLGDLTAENTQSIALNGPNPTIDPKNCDTREFTYTQDGFNLIQTEKHGSKETLYQYKPNTNLVIAIFVKDLGLIKKRTFYSYDDSANLIEAIEDDGSTLDPDDLTDVTVRLIKRIVPRTTNPAMGQPLEISEYYYDLHLHACHLLKKEKYEYDQDHNLTKRQVIGSTGLLAYETSYKYDDFHNLIEETDAVGNVTRYQYDRNNNLLKVFLPKKGSSIEYTYDFVNRKTSETWIEGQETKTTRFIYDNSHNLVCKIDENENETRFVYDHLNRLIETVLPKVQDETQNVIQAKLIQSYDALGHLSKATDAKGNSTYTTHTVRGQVASIVYPDGSKEICTYYPNGNLKQKVTKTGLTIQYTYDYQDRVITTKTTDAKTGKTYIETNTYNAFNLLSHTDANGHTTFYTYDGANRLKEKTQQLQRIVYEYDELSRVHKESYYDETGLQYCLLKSYDNLNRLLEENWTLPEGTVQKKVAYEYDAFNNRTKLVTYGANGPEVHETIFDLWKRPIKVQDPEGSVTLFEYKTVYNEIGQRVNQTVQIDPQGLKTITTFNALNRAVEIKKEKTKLLSEKRLVYDLNGNLCSSIEKAIGSDRLFITQATFDALNRPIVQIIGKQTPQEKVTKFVYNLEGFLAEKVKPDGIRLLFTYDGLGNKLTLRSSDRVIEYAFEYDLNSNLTKAFSNGKVLCERKYDFCNLLVEETLKTITYKKQRDALGRVICYTLPDGSQIFYQYKGIYVNRIRKKSASSQQHFVWEGPAYDLSGRLLSQPILGTNSNVQYLYNKKGLQIALTAPTYREEVQYDSVSNPTRHTIKGEYGAFTHAFAYDELYQLSKESGKFNHTYEHDSLYNLVQIDQSKCTVNAVNQLESISQDTICKYDPNGNLIYKKTAQEEVYYKYDPLDRLLVVESVDNYIIHFQYDHNYRRLEQYVQVWEKSLLAQASSLLKENVSKTLYEKEHLLFLYDDMREIGSFEEYKLKEFKLVHPNLSETILALEINGYCYTPIQDYRLNISAIISQGKTYPYQTYRYSAFGERVAVDAYGALAIYPESAYGYMGKRHITQSTLIAFTFRDYDRTLHRWLTPDPAGFVDGLNLYAFVRNNPLSYIDILGLKSESMGFKVPELDFSQASKYFKIENILQNLPAFNKYNYNFSTNNFNLPIRAHVAFINGMRNTHQQAQASADYLSGLLGKKVGLIFSEREANFFKDFSIAAKNRFGISKNGVNSVTKYLLRFHAENPPETRLIIIAHSAGANRLGLSLAELLYSGEDDKIRAARRVIQAIAIAPGGFISKKLCDDVLHIVNYGDPIPHLLPGKCIAEREGTLLQLTPQRQGIINHSLNSSIYVEPLKRQFELINKKYIIE